MGTSASLHRAKDFKEIAPSTGSTVQKLVIRVASIQYEANASYILCRLHNYTKTDTSILIG